MYELKITSAAVKDFDESVNYLVNVLCNKKAAKDLADAFHQCQLALKANPFIYSLCTDECLSNLGYRRAILKNYIVVFKIEQSRRKVTILRLFHGSRKYQDLL